ncbi:HlyD family secretion protein [Dendrosporobacter sp. 1207_IL3150]|uniref:HlyD family secretion protein n=1 Tax=Dendrosporobacter sp. 1207_IL3150 TaxID=3084054 RepID=UPI002FD93A94
MQESTAQSNVGKQQVIIRMMVGLLLVGLIGGGWWWYQTAKFVATDDARVSGNIVTVGAKISGRISEVLVKEGDIVQAGQIIARIDARDATAVRNQAEAALLAAKARYDELTNGSRPEEINQARAGVEQANANVDQAKANLDNAVLNFERMKKLYNEGAISIAQRDNAETAYRVAQEALNSTEQIKKAAGDKLELVVNGAREETIRAAAAQVKQAEAALEAARITMGETSIIAPVNGSIALKSINAGEIVIVGQPMFSITNLKDVWVNARIEETKIGKLRVGQKVDYTIDGYPGRTFTGTIYDIGTAANSVFALIPTENSSNNFTKVTQRIPIKITLPENSDVPFRPGMSAYVKIKLD